MNNNCKNLPGVKRLYWLLCDNLTPKLMRKSIAGLPVMALAGRNEIPFSGNPTVETSTELVNNSYMETVTLEFDSSENIDTSRPIAFFILDVNEQGWLIGTRELPYPQVQKGKALGSPSGSTTASRYTVTLTAPKALLEALV